MSMHSVMLQHYVYITVSSSEEKGVPVDVLCNEVSLAMKRDGYIISPDEVLNCVEEMPCAVLEGNRWKIMQYTKKEKKENK